MEQVRVSARVDVAGLEEAINRFGKFSGSVNDTERAFRQIGVTAQDAVRAGGYVTPDQMEKMTRNLDNLKRGEAEINRLLQERTTRLNEIVSKSSVIKALMAQGVPLEEAVKAQIGGPGRLLGGGGYWHSWR